MNINRTVRHISILLILLLGMSLSRVSYSQWLKAFQFPTGARTIYFLDGLGHPEMGFAGLVDGSIWKTMDYGISWQRKFQDINQLSVTDIYFKDSITGWFCTKPDVGQNVSSQVSSSVYRTTDGGINWVNIMSDLGGEFSALCYYRPQKTLYLSEWARGAFSSIDDGDNWNEFTTESPLNGYAFSDIQPDGILTYAGGALKNIYETNNGGVIWQHIFPATRLGSLRQNRVRQLFSFSANTIAR